MSDRFNHRSTPTLLFVFAVVIIMMGVGLLFMANMMRRFGASFDRYEDR